MIQKYLNESTKSENDSQLTHQDNYNLTQSTTHDMTRNDFEAILELVRVVMMNTKITTLS